MKTAWSSEILISGTRARGSERSAPDRIRGLRPSECGAGDGNRTRAVSLGSLYRAWSLSWEDADLWGVLRLPVIPRDSPLLPLLMGT